MNIIILMGSARKNGTGAQVGEWVQSVVATDKRFVVDYIVASELNLPFFNEDFSPKYRHYSDQEYTNAAGKEWAARVAKADGFIFITPEYNHSYSAALKNALDWVGTEWSDKPVGFVGYSITQFGGVRAVEHLRQIAPELGLIQTRIPVLISGVPDSITENNDSAPRQAMSKLLDELYTTPTSRHAD